jgi:Xanthosine triphosphate pyrophosphatase
MAGDWRGWRIMLEIIYGTGNGAKISYMEETLKNLPVKIVGLHQAAEKEGIILPDIKETGENPLENARLKAEGYFRVFGKPVFSCDSGIYLWNYTTKEPLPDEEQPGIHIRGNGERRLGDEELLAYYIGLVKKYGQVCGRFKNGICLIWNGQQRKESMSESMWGEPFLLTDKPHEKRVEGFPVDRISLDISTGKYLYDLEEDSEGEEAQNRGFENFFRECLTEWGLL